MRGIGFYWVDITILRRITRREVAYWGGEEWFHVGQGVLEFEVSNINEAPIVENK